MLGTLRIGQKIRPKALWGFFEFPICNTNAGQKKEKKCNKEFYKFNEE